MHSNKELLIILSCCLASTQHHGSASVNYCITYM